VHSELKSLYAKKDKGKKKRKNGRCQAWWYISIIPTTTELEALVLPDYKLQSIQESLKENS
jgi:hypothetical protein